MAPINLFDLFAKISLDTSEYDSGVKDVSKSGDSLSSKLKNGLAKAGKVAAVGIGAITTAAGAAVGALLSLEQSTEEYRIAQGKLNTAFEAAGYSTETAKEAYNAFYGILGDTDTATEASQLLAKLADSAEDVSVWTDIAAGVAGTFGDALPIEGLIESANETSRVGQVTGSLADALNWAGISEDEFNEKLAACSDETKRNQLIMDTLAGTYDEASDAFYRNNEALVESRNNQARIDEALGKVGESVTNLKNKFLEQFGPAIENISTKMAEFIAGIDLNQVMSALSSLKDTFVNLLPVITGATTAILAYKAASAISGIIDALRVATEGQTIAQTLLNAVMNANPFVLVATLIAGLVTALITLWNTNDEFRAAVEPIWEGIKSLFISAWEAIQGVWNAVAPFFQAIWDSISATFSSVVEFFSGLFSRAWEGIKTVWDAVKGYFQNIWDTITGIFSVVKDFFTGNFGEAWQGIKDIFSGWGEYFQGLWNDITGIFGKAWEWFKGIGEDIVNGIWNGIAGIWDNLVSWFNNLWDGLVGGVKEFLGIASPSRVFAGIGENMALGVGEGWDNEFGAIKKDIERGMDFGTANVAFESSGLAQSQRGVNSLLNGINATMGQNFTIVVQSVLDGKIIGESAYQYSRNKARAYGG